MLKYKFQVGDLPEPEPTHYDGHVDRIKRLRLKGDVSLLRQARESMNTTFPLSPGQSLALDILF